MLAALQEKLLPRELFDEFCAEYTREVNRLRGEARADIVAAERELVKLEARRKTLVALVMDGVPGSEVKDELLAIVARREELQQQVALLRDLKPLILHPNMATLYREYVIEARAALAPDRYRAGGGGRAPQDHRRYHPHTGAVDDWGSW